MGEAWRRGHAGGREEEVVLDAGMEPYPGAHLGGFLHPSPAPALHFDLEALLKIDDLRSWIQDLEASRGRRYQTLYSDYDDYDSLDDGKTRRLPPPQREQRDFLAFFPPSH